MTDLLTPPALPSAPAPASPRARRWRRSRLRDGRLVAGVVLMLVAVVVGARVVGAATHRTSWLATTRALPAGHVIEAGDLTQVGAHLPEGAQPQYFTADPASLVGRTVSRPLASGELLPAAAVTSSGTAAGRIVPLVVKAGRLPVLQPGDRVDVYVLAPAASRGGTAREVRVLEDVEFTAADVLSSGDTSISLRVAPTDALAAVAASQSQRVDVVRVERDASGAPGDAGPDSSPAFGD